MPDRAPRIGTPEQYASGQALPIGKTCGNCWFFKFSSCAHRNKVIAADELCVYTPSQYKEPSVNGGMGLLKVSLGERLKGGARG